MRTSSSRGLGGAPESLCGSGRRSRNHENASYLNPRRVVVKNDSFQNQISCTFLKSLNFITFPHTFRGDVLILSE